MMRKRTFLKLAQWQAELTEQHLGEVRAIHREMRAYKHDFHHHLELLKSYLEAGETDRALAYVRELDENLRNVDPLVKTGNVSLDAILSAKLGQAKEAGISVNVKAAVPDSLTLTDVELCAVVANLLDNALEACAAAEGERFIRLYMTMKGKMLYFSMLNAAGPKKQKNGGLFRTDKSGMHGFGLRRARSILEAHDGWLKVNSEDGAFTTEFLVPALP
ncbi:MAG: GHKL domain-containing protein [Oscillospiraceae bacterium]|nr:GHKL domain-containing protein [Oscillospiraceae bacterium]